MINVLRYKKIYDQNTQDDKKGKKVKTKMGDFAKQGLQSFGKLLINE